MTLYHSGDTSYITEMTAVAEGHIDFAFIPVDDGYNMGAVGAKLVAETILAEVIVPIHTDGELDWNLNKAERLKVDNRLIILPRETLEIK